MSGFLTEEQIERAVSQRIDAIDRQWLHLTNRWTRAEYDARIAEVDAWAARQFRISRKQGVV
jgi:hypothetical protein